MAPIFISRYCEPFLSPNYRKHSLYVANNFIENGSQVIFNTLGGEHFDNIEVIDFIKKNNSKIMLQFKMFNTDNTEAGKIIRNSFSPNMENRFDTIKKFDFVDRVIVIDPLILGVNDIDFKNIIIKVNEIGIKKVIIKQLFSTDYFKHYLELHTGKSSFLSEQVGKFWTYNNHGLLKSLLDGLELCYKYNIDVQFCNNRELNKVLNNKKYNNCCMLENPIGLYDIDKPKMDRKGSSIIRFNNE
jgi:DNA repair photolyase